MIALTKVSGPFTAGEVLKRGATAIGATLGTEPSVDPQTVNDLLAAAAERYRADIGPVPGSGPLRGGAVLDGVVYAMRDNVGATAQAIYKATATGWQLVPLLHEIAFTGGSAEYLEGSMLSKGGVTATVKRVVLESGAWTGTAAGRLIITAPSGGAFTAGAAAGGGSCTLSGASSAISLLPGGKWQWRAYNFSGDPGRMRLYGCDGKNRPVEFDGQVLAPINTGMPANVPPQCIEVHRNHLFLAFEGSVQSSAPGDPYRWSPINGAAELTAGDAVTGLLSVAGAETSAALLVSCRNSTFVIYGYGQSDWSMVNLSRTAGARDNSLRQLFGVLAFDDQGCRTISTTQAFGNFQFDTNTDRIRVIAAGFVPAASLVDAVNGRYKVFRSDGYGLVGAQAKKGMAWLPIKLAHDVNITIEGEIGGVPCLFFGGSDGYLRQMDRGRSFDGQAINAWLRVAYADLGSPMSRKAFRRLELEVRGESTGAIRAQCDFSLGDISISPTPVQAGRFQGPANYWDLGSWDVGEWDGAYATRLRLRCEGTGTSVSLLVNSSSASELPHELLGFLVTYIKRRNER